LASGDGPNHFIRAAVPDHRVDCRGFHLRRAARPGTEVRIRVGRSVDNLNRSRAAALSKPAALTIGAQIAVAAV